MQSLWITPLFLLVLAGPLNAQEPLVPPRRTSMMPFSTNGFIALTHA